MSRLLDRAAGAYGIERAFVDNSGQLQITSPDTKRALLAAMGVPTATTGELKDAIARATQADLTPPVIVVRAGEDTAVLVPALARAAAWQLALESGDTFAGPVRHQGGSKNRLLLPAPLPVGYHRLELQRPGGLADTIQLVAAPAHCLLPEDLGAGQVFGLGCQVYALRTGRDLGCGDLADLGALAERGGAEGADFIGVNPLHALFFAEPAASSPYAPSQRAFLNWLLVAPGDVPEIREQRELMARLEREQDELRSRRGSFIDYPDTARRRRALLELAFDLFRRQHLGGSPSPRGAAFLAFRARGGEPLQQHCLFEALHAHVLESGRSRWAWWEWPDDYRQLGHPSVAAFAREHEARVAFFAWLQWLADEQLAGVQARAEGAGMRLGLYRDLAVGVNPAGSLGWSRPDVVVRRASIGAPPDAFSPKGQSWGLAPLAPRALEAAAFGPWLADIRANMRHAGALRIDHVMGLRRLFWVPEGGSPADGAYVRYPFTTMAAILAVESHRARCLVVGEDLGTLPRGFRPALRRAGILSCRVFYFERERNEGFAPARRYRHASVASVTTHDLPTLRGFLEEQDIDWRARLDLFHSVEEAEQNRRERKRDRARLVRLLQRAGLLESANPGLEETALALHRWLARTPAALMLVQLEDLALQLDQTNLPGTTTEHPNWSRRLEQDLDRLLQAPFARRMLRMLREERPGKDRDHGPTAEQPNARGVVFAGQE
jgi:4-alpha-glucanotransferase